MKKILSFILCVAVLATMCASMSMSVFAAEYEIDVDANIFSDFDDNSTITLKKDITSTGAGDQIIVVDKTLTFNLNGHTLTLTDVILSGNANVTFKNGTLRTIDEMNSNASVITVNGSSKLTLDKMQVISGSSKINDAGNDAISMNENATATITNSYIKGGDVKTYSELMVAGSALFLGENTKATVSDSTLELGKNSDYYIALSPVSSYGKGKLYNGANSALITAPKYTSEAQNIPLVIGAGYPISNDGGNTLTSVVPGENSASKDVKGTYVAGSTSAKVYSVDVAWGSMEFTYTEASKGTWNPEKHEYENVTPATWSNVVDANKVSVTNHSNAWVEAILSYASNSSYSDITGSFVENSDTANDGKLSLPSAVDTEVASAPSASAILNLSGALENTTTAKTKIGTITVTIVDYLL